MIKTENAKRVVFYTDDDLDDLDTFKDIIKEIGHDIDLYTHSKADKLLVALDNPPPVANMIFLDLNMPGKNGFDVLRELRGDSNFKQLPVVILSTSNDKLSIDNSRKLGANYYIHKANNYTQLKASVQHALNIDWDTFTADASNFVYKH